MIPEIILTGKSIAADEAGEVAKLCYENVFVVLRCGVYHNVIRILMPLVITDDQLEKGLSILEGSLSKLHDRNKENSN